MKRLAISACCMAAAVVIAVIIAAPRIERRVRERIRGIFRERDGEELKFASVRLGLRGIYLIEVSYTDGNKGVAFSSRRVLIGPWWKLVKAPAAEIQDGLLVVEDCEKALAASSTAAPFAADVRYDGLGVEVGLRGQRMVLGGVKGDLSLGKDGSIKCMTDIERVNGEQAGLHVTYDDRGANKLVLRADTTVFRRLLPEEIRLEGYVGFAGNMKGSPVRGTGCLELEELGVTAWGIEAEGLIGSIEIGVAKDNISAKAVISSGTLKTSFTNYDFTGRPALLRSEVQRAGNVWQASGSFTAPEGLSAEWEGTATAAPGTGSPPKVNVTLTISDLPLGPLIKVPNVKVTSDGKVTRRYRITGTWPKPEICAETSVNGFGVAFPSAGLSVEGIDAGPLEGRWGTEAP
ncbi:MAG: hypothetical protein JW909_11015 [Planctomycetes bacterium]|nr:hypothetical protein [Planctomycetota bacterium]